jgi:hypothetical protein
MSGISLDDLPPMARAAWADLRDRLVAILGDDLVAMWAHGGTVSTGDPPHAGDLDTYVVIARRPDAATVALIEEAHATTEETHGVEWDVEYILADAAWRDEPPSHAWRERSRDTSWAIHRSHWLDGRYVLLHGAGPAEVVPPPTPEVVISELDRELEHIERHVHEGDTDPYEATYAHLTGCRILHALATGNVAISKRAAGDWGLEHLPAAWHEALRAAIRTYEGRGSVEDAALLAAGMERFVDFVRAHLPPTTERRPGWIPRWSGY